MTFKSAPDYEDPKDSNKDQDYVFNLVVEDEGGLTASTSVIITVEDLDGSVSLTAPVSSAVTVAEGTSIAFTVAATTGDTSNELTYSIGDAGVDGALFNIDSDDGTVTFGSTPDAENPTDNDEMGTYEVEVIVTDSTGATAAATTVTVTVDDTHDEQPEFSSISSTVTSVSGASSSSASVELADDEEGSLEIEIQEISGTTATVTLAAITFANGEATLASSPNMTFELSSNNSSTSNFSVFTASSGATAEIKLKAGATLDYEDDSNIVLTLTATDAGGDTAKTEVTISVLDVDEAPYKTGSVVVTSCSCPQLAGQSGGLF